MDVRMIWAAGLSLALLIGCGGGADDRSADAQGQTWEQLRDSKADALRPRDKFEKSKDPPINAQTHFAAGQLAESRGQHATAADQYRRAVKLDPKYKEALYRLGVVYAILKQHSDAIDIWQRYLKVTDRSAEAYSNLGFAYELAGQPADAETAYQQGIERDPKNVACRVNYGLMLARQGKTAEATTQLQTVLSEPEVHYNLASVYESQGQKEQAKAEYRKALELAPEFKDAQARLAALQ